MDDSLTSGWTPPREYKNYGLNTRSTISSIARELIPPCGSSRVTSNFRRAFAGASSRDRTPCPAYQDRLRSHRSR
jgi:hypothetical protein